MTEKKPSRSCVKSDEHYPCGQKNQPTRKLPPELTTQEPHIVVALILVDQLVSPLFVSRSQFI
jgi:hypothetical protein